MRYVNQRLIDTRKQFVIHRIKEVGIDYIYKK